MALSSFPGTRLLRTAFAENQGEPLPKGGSSSDGQQNGTDSTMCGSLDPVVEQGSFDR